MRAVETENSIESFEIFPWDKNFETGITLIDEQHQKLVQILNHLAVHLANRSSKKILNEVFDELFDYAEYHFKAEEDVWRKHLLNDESLNSHEKTHKSFISYVILITHKPQPFSGGDKASAEYAKQQRATVQS
ncbi:MAG: hemerythrin domain-containing protein, partial [Candidatus Thiodiazotropha sp.]